MESFTLATESYRAEIEFNVDDTSDSSIADIVSPYSTLVGVKVDTLATGADSKDSFIVIVLFLISELTNIGLYAENLFSISS